MFDWKIRYSRTARVGDRISCEMGEVEVYADTEEEARKIFAEEMPSGSVIDAIEQVKEQDA